MNNQSFVLEVTNLNAGYNGRAVLVGVSLTIRPRQSVALIGPNGCGKSTLFRVIAGTVPSNDGEIRLCGNLLFNESTDTRVRQGLGYLMQVQNIFVGLTVMENLALAANSVYCSDTDARMRVVLAAFPQISEIRTKRAGLLSGGQRQALAVAMVLMRPAKLILLDEPVAGLSLAAGRDMLEGVRRLQAADGFAMIIVEHRLRQVQPYVGRVIVMREGRIVDDTTDTTLMCDRAWLSKHYTNDLQT